MVALFPGRLLTLGGVSAKRLARQALGLTHCNVFKLVQVKGALGPTVCPALTVIYALCHLKNPTSWSSIGGATTSL